jgi:hypothetical protein
MNLCCDVQCLDVCDYDAGEGLGRMPCLADLQRIDETYELIQNSYRELKRLCSLLVNTDPNDPEIESKKQAVESESVFLTQLINGLAAYSTELYPSFGIILENRFTQLQKQLLDEVYMTIQNIDDLLL